MDFLKQYRHKLLTGSGRNRHYTDCQCIEYSVKGMINL